MALELKDESDTWTITDADVMPDGGDKDTVYTVRRLTLDKHREITKLHTKKANYRKPERPDIPKIQDALFDYVLVDWKGVVKHGQPVPCVWEHKRLIDIGRRVALLDEAGLNEIEKASAAKEEEEGERQESFRPTAVVR
jgi:hypothetical protein